MTSVEAIASDPAQLTVDAVVVGIYADDDGLRLAAGSERVDAAFSQRLTETFALLGATGAVGEVTKLASLGAIPAPLVAAVGLGDPQKVTSDTLRRAAGAATRALAGSEKIALALPTEAAGTEVSYHAAGVLAEGALLGGYRFGGYKSKPDPAHRSPVRSICVVLRDGAQSSAKPALKRAVTVSRVVATARDWVNTAPNVLRPPRFAELVAEAADKAGLDVEILDEKALRKGGYGGILAVGGGSAAPPRLVRLAYRPKRATCHVALVGKGITFDTGGVSIKPAHGMWEMTSDMAGAAAIGATMLAVAALKPGTAVTGYLPMAENMPSGSSYRPGDVVTMYSGRRVEVLNTDAEGRMILGDAISRACEDEPDYLLEASTLTGGQVTALGTRMAGVMGSEDLCERVRRAGERTGEPCWPMPMPEDVRKAMESEVADTYQVAAGMDRAGHMSQGAVFLSGFVPDGLPWAHIDMAGPGYHTGEPYGYISRGGTGFPVRTLIEMIEDIATNG
jgi:leucyl aminopeptidase